MWLSAKIFYFTLMKDRKDLLFHLGIAISTANLLLLPVWWELLFIKDQAYYYMLSPPVRSDYLAAVAGTFLLSAILFFCARLARRTKITWLQTVTKLTFLLLLFIPLNTMRLGAPVQLGFGIWMARLRLPNFMIPVFLGALIFSVIVIRFRRQTFKIILLLVLSQLPFAAITIGQAFLKGARARDHDSLPQSWSGPSTLEVNDERRLVWIRFDELDESMLFSHRPSGLTLPAFDSFRKESVRSTRARAPSTN